MVDKINMNKRKVSLFMKVKKGTKIKKKNKELPSLLISSKKEPSAAPAVTVACVTTASTTPVAVAPKTTTNTGLVVIKKKRYSLVEEKNQVNKAQRKQDKKNKINQLKANIQLRKKNSTIHRTERQTRRKEAPIIEDNYSDNYSNADSEESEELDIDNGREEEINDEDYKKIIKSIDPDMNCDREELIDKLETYKYKQNKKIKRYRKQKKDTAKHVKQYNSICSLLANIKETDAKLKIAKDHKARIKIKKEFKKKFKKLKRGEFKKCIDLTAPKEEREPEVGVSLWKKSKDVTFKDNTYKKKKDKEKRRILNRITKKENMNDDMIKQIERSQDSNLQKVNITQNHRNLLAYQKYNPFNYRGITCW